MNLNQIYNLFSFIGILSLDNDLILTSPDYIEAKTLNFLNFSLGKNEFIKIPTSYYCSKNYEHTTEKFWEDYCKIWKCDKEDYPLMNVFNFLLESNFPKHGIFSEHKEDHPKISIELFEKYIGDIKDIEKDNSYKTRTHPNIRDYIKEYLDLYSRYIKLLTL